MKSFIFILAMALFGKLSLATNEKVPKLPNSDQRRKMVAELKKEIDRIDGDGLIPRENRPEKWDVTLDRLQTEAAKSETLYDLGRVFKRIDATYPNLHAKIYLLPELDENKKEGAVVLPFRFHPDKVEQGKTITTYKVSVQEKDFQDLRDGDELLSINNVAIGKWSEENFIFCKFPFREQCEIEFFENFKKELLGWSRHQDLRMQIKRGASIIDVSVKPIVKSNSPDSGGDETEGLPCGVPKSRYPGFSIAYEGQHLCAFESRKNPNVVAIRIRSFQYQDVPFAVLDGEVQLFWNNYWSKKSARVSKLILDVIDNRGGQSPIPYYGLFFSKPYQEQFVQFKKISEFEQNEILESLFWGDGGKEVWFENIKKDGTFTQAKSGDFLSPIPQFCTRRDKDCREGLFEPRPHKFKGKIHLLMNHWCVSSCVGFVSNIKDLLKSRVKTFGIPDSGDSAYSRLAILVTPKDGRGVEAKISSPKKARKPDSPEAWVRQVVSVTRSTDREGHIISGQPQGIDVWVPRLWNQSDEEWASRVFKAALK